MTNPAPMTIRLTFADADPSTPDPAAVGALARAAVGGLRAAGESLAADYTGAKGAAEVFQWMLNAATVAGPLITLSGMSLTLAQLLNEIRKLREKDQTAPPPQQITIVVRHEYVTATVRADAAPDADALLAQLLAEGLPAQLNPADTTITVQVPPTPPNEI